MHDSGAQIAQMRFDSEALTEFGEKAVVVIWQHHSGQSRLCLAQTPSLAVYRVTLFARDLADSLDGILVQATLSPVAVQSGTDRRRRRSCLLGNVVDRAFLIALHTLAARVEEPDTPRLTDFVFRE